MGYLEEDDIETSQYEKALNLLCKTNRIEIFELLSYKIEDYISHTYRFFISYHLSILDSKFIILLSYLVHLR